MRIGRPIRAADLLGHAGGNRRDTVDAIGLAVAEVLPPSYRGAYADAARYPSAAAALRRARLS
jgi:hypothetical protein